MNVKGKLEKRLATEKGTSKAGKDWEKVTIIINTGDQYNPLVAISFFGTDKIKMLEKFKQGQEVEVSINVSSREFEGKWFHNIDGWKINEVKVPEGVNIADGPEDDNDPLPF